LQPGEVFARDIQIKFRKIIVPGIPLALSLRLDRQRNRLSFAYDSGKTCLSAGSIAMGP